jgi:hypothetical protein
LTISGSFAGLESRFDDFNLEMLDGELVAASVRLFARISNLVHGFTGLLAWWIALRPRIACLRRELLSRIRRSILVRIYTDVVYSSYPPFAYRSRHNSRPT